MLMHDPLSISQQLLAVLGTKTFLHHQDRIPTTQSIIVVSNHRSFMDAPLLMATINRPIRFACHHYMGQVPLMRDVVTRFGGFPLDVPEQRQQTFFEQATHLLQSHEAVGIFPEGARPMVQLTDAEQVGEFHRGFAHLALRAPVQDLAILPIAIASFEEATNSVLPLKVLRFFDPSEPLFDQAGWHPMVFYRRVNMLIGRPLWITASQRQRYQGKDAKAVVANLTAYCQSEISNLLRQGY